MVDGQLSLQAYTVFTENRVLTLLLKSLVTATGATLLSVFLGVPFAMFLGKYSFRGKGISLLLFLVPLFIPPHVHALSWLNLFGEKGVLLTSTALYSVPGVSVLLFLAYCPILILLLLTGIHGTNHQLEESASLLRPPWDVFWKISLPLLKPYLVAGSIFVFLFSFFNYGIPSMLRISTFPVEIFSRYSAFYDEATAVALSTPMIVGAMMLLAIQSRQMANKSYALLSPQQNRRKECVSKTLSVVAPLYIHAFITVTVLLPLVSLLLQSGGVKSFQIAWQTSFREICITFCVAAITATIATMLSYLFAVLIDNREGKFSTFINYCTFLPFACPATLFGIGLIRLWNSPNTQLVYSTGTILVFAYIARFIPFGIRIVNSRKHQVRPELFEAAHLSESSWLKKLWYVYAPLMRPGLIACWTIIFIFCVGELGATLLLIPPGMGTVTLKIYTLMHYGAGPVVAALALILIAMNVLAASILTFQKTSVVP